VAFKSPFDALDAGIGMVHQEFSLLPGFTACENIMLNREPVRSNPAVEVFGERLATLKRDTMEERAAKTIAKLGVNIAVDTVVSEMPVAHKQFTEIAREIDRDQVKLLVLDEPTAVLTEGEAEILLAALKRLATEGISIIFISHRLREVIQIADRIVVLRDGQVVKDTENLHITVPDITTWMVGRDVSEQRASGRKRELSGEAFRVDHLWVDMPGETVRDVSFSVRQGEIFGIGGLAGQGKLGIPNGIMGLYAAGGSARMDGKDLPLGDPRLVLDSGCAFVSEDRRGVGLLLDESLDWNIAFGAMQTKGAYLKSFFGGLFKLRDEKAMAALAEEYIGKLELKCTGGKAARQGTFRGEPAKGVPRQGLCAEPQAAFCVRAHPGHRRGGQENSAGHFALL
jgi:simple sugar transport system ATP-binding protein